MVFTCDHASLALCACPCPLFCGQAGPMEHRPLRWWTRLRQCPQRARGYAATQGQHWHVPGVRCFRRPCGVGAAGVGERPHRQRLPRRPLPWSQMLQTTKKRKRTKSRTTTTMKTTKRKPPMCQQRERSPHVEERRALSSQLSPQSEQHSGCNIKKKQ